MKEAIGNSEAVRSLRHYGWGAMKISDVMGSRFTEKKPYDIVACSPKGRHVVIEGKMIKNWKGFNEKALRPHQIQALKANCMKRRGRSFVFLYVRIPRNPSKGTPTVTKLVIFDFKKHWRHLKGKGYNINQIRNQEVGAWLNPQKVDGKIIWPLKKLLKL